MKTNTPPSMQSMLSHQQDAAAPAPPITPVTELGLTKFLDPLHIPPVITVPAGKPHAALKITMRPCTAPRTRAAIPTARSTEPRSQRRYESRAVTTASASRA